MEFSGNDRTIQETIEKKENNKIKGEYLSNGALLINAYEPWYEGNELIDTQSSMTVQQKWARIVLQLKEMNGFSYALYLAPYISAHG